MSLMPGGRGVFPTLTVAENLRLSCWLIRKDTDRRAEAARSGCSSLFPILRDRDRRRTPGTCPAASSRCSRSRWRSCARPKLLCIDELSLGLAPTVVGRLVDTVREIHAQGTTVILVEQSVNVALLLAERAVFLEKGQVRFRGPTARLLERPDVLRAVFLGGAAGRRAARKSSGARDERRAADVTLDAARSASVRRDRRRRRRRPRCRNPGTIVGLIGHNGAGKTTLFDLMTGFHRTATGAASCSAATMSRETRPHRRAIAGLGRSFQEARLFPTLTVRERSPSRSNDISRAAIRSRRPCASRHPPRRRRPSSERVDELIELLGLEPYADKLTGDLSTGTRRIVELGCMLALDPRCPVRRAVGRDRAARDRGARPPVAQGADRRPGARWS